MKEKPLGVKILGVLYYIGSAVSILFAVLFFFLGLYLVQNASAVEAEFSAEDLAAIGSVVTLVPLFFVFAGFSLVVGVLDFFLGRGFWKAQNWARIFVLVCSFLGIAYGLFYLISGLYIFDSITLFAGVLNIAINGFLVWYLMKKNVIHYFAKKKV